MYQPTYETSAPSVKEARPLVNARKTSLKNGSRKQQTSDNELWRPADPQEGRCGRRRVKVEGQEHYAVTPLVTWRHRQRRSPKDKTPITKAAALQYAQRLREKYLTLLGEPRIEATNHHRLRGDLAQSLADVIERVYDVNPQARGKAVQSICKVSKKGYGSLRATESRLSAPVPDHWSSGNGEYLIPAPEHYQEMLAAISHFENVVRGLPLVESGCLFVTGTRQEDKRIMYLLPNPLDWRLPLGAVSGATKNLIQRTDVFQTFLDLAPMEESYNPNWRKRGYND